MIIITDGIGKIEVNGVFMSIDDIESKLNLLEEAWQELKGAEEESDND